MNKVRLLFLTFLVNLSIFAMESEIIKYDDISFATPEQISDDLLKVPADLREDVETWNNENDDILDEFVELPSTVAKYQQAVQRRNHFKQPHAKPHDVGQWNHIFHTKKAVVRIPGLQNALSERVSAMGADPFNQRQIQAKGGYPAALAANKPRQQGISRLLAAHMLKQLNSTAIKTPEVYALHLKGKPKDLDDRNYVMIQRKFPENLLSFDQLTGDQKKQVFENLPLQDLYNGVKYTALWQFKGDDVYVNPENIQEIWLIDLEKPNNEGYDPSAAHGQRGSSFRNVAVYGKDKDKWKFNIYEHAFQQIRNWINQHAPERVAEWDQLKKQDPDA